MSTAEGISDVAAEGFGAGAAAYEKGRPSYSDDVVATYIQPMDPETLVQRVLSTSYIARLPAAEQTALAARVRDLVAPLGDSFELPYVSVAYATTLR